MKFRRFMKCVGVLLMLTGVLCTTGISQAATITFNDTTLGAGGVSFNVGGLGLTASTSNGGQLTSIGSGIYTGLHVGVNQSFGSYTLSFSQAISSIEIEFDALSSTGGSPVETITNFATSNGAATISYTNQFGTTFNGTTIFSTAADGQGIINFSGAGFTSFSFVHAQNPNQNGFVIERVAVNTATQAVPEPTSLMLFGSGLIGLVGWKRRR